MSPAEPLGYRHVRLRCGTVVLSQAHNWYVPVRLTPAMNAALDRSDVPFGTVTAPLGFARRRLSDRTGRGEGCPPGTILTHRAVLAPPGGAPISLVVECYAASALASPAPATAADRSKPRT